MPVLRLIAYLKDYKKDYNLGIVYSIINKIFDIAPEVLIGVAVDTVVSQENSLLAKIGFVDVYDQVIVLGIITFFIWVFESISQYLCSVTWLNLSQKIQHDLRDDTYTHIQKISSNILDKFKSGNLQSILGADINLLEKFLEKGANQIIQVFTSSVVIGAIFFYLAPELALAAILPVPLIILGAFYFQHLLEPRFLKIRQKAGTIGSVIANNLAGMMTIKSFTAEKYARAQVKQVSDDYVKANKHAIALSSAVTPVIRIAVLAGFLATLIYGSFLTLEGSLAVGSFSVLVFLTQRLLWPLTMLADITIEYQKAMASTTRVLDLLDLPAEDNHKGIKLEQVKGEIKIDDLCFGYTKQDSVFKNLNLAFKAGSSTAIVGDSGAGKSTLIKLLLKLQTQQSGNILLDGTDIKEINNYNLRQNISFISQEAFIFNSSVIANIAYGQANADINAVIQAAKIAQADEFITQLPQGYNTVLSENGNNLSGGQKQRIAIARAIFKHAPVLILDEATSALDNHTEHSLRHSLAKLPQDCTKIIIAHRLSSICHLDNILVLEQGQIIEQGTHAQLLERQGKYATLWQLQTGK